MGEVIRLPLPEPVPEEEPKEHQPVFRYSGNKNTVSCTCRRQYGRHVRVRNSRYDTDYYEPMPWPSGETWKQVYNRPKNHSSTFSHRWMIS